MQTYQLRASGLDYRYRLLCPGALKIYLPCNLFLAHAAFAEDDAVGVCLGYAPDRLLNLLEFSATSLNQYIVKLHNNTFWFGIPANCLNELLVDSRSLNDVNGSAVFHHIGNLQRIQVIHYGNYGEFVTLALLPVD